MSDIEKDIKRCEELIKPEHANWIGISNQLAIAGVLAEREQDKARIKELEAKQKEMCEEYCPKTERIKELEEINTANRKVIVEQCDYMQNKSIPVQKVKDNIERYEYMLAETIHGEIQKYTPREILLKIDTLKELLEEK